MCPVLDSSSYPQNTLHETERHETMEICVESFDGEKYTLSECVHEYGGGLVDDTKCKCVCLYSYLDRPKYISGISGGFRAILCARKRPKLPEMQISGEFGRFFLSENRLGRVLLIFAISFLYLEIFDVKSVKISNNRKLLYT